MTAFLSFPIAILPINFSCFIDFPRITGVILNHSGDSCHYCLSLAFHEKETMTSDFIFLRETKSRTWKSSPIFHRLGSITLMYLLIISFIPSEKLKCPQ